MATESDSTAHYFIPNETLFKCDICVLTFRTSSERNAHILDHFRRTTCSICHQTLVQLGNIWYSSHEHPNHNDIKTEFDPDEVNECLAEPVVFSNSGRDHLGLLSTKIEVDPIENLWDEPNAVENVLETASVSFMLSENVATTDLAVTSHSVSIPSSTSYKKTHQKRSNACLQSNTQKVRAMTKRRRTATSGQDGFQCEICTVEFSTEASLIEHKNVYHQEDIDIDISNGLKFENSPIARSTADATIFKEHTTAVQSHTRGGTDSKYTVQESGTKFVGTCDICNKTLRCKSGLIYHMNIHLGLRPFACNLCNRSFMDKRNLNRHVKTHAKDDLITLNIRNYEDIPVKKKEKVVSSVDWVCEYCNDDFELEKRLVKHISKEHNEDKPIQHQCNICAERFNSLNHLLVHIRAHPESTQHECTYDGCGQRFAYKANLGTHLNKHNRINGPIIRKTQDDITETALQHADGLREEIPSSGNPFACPICSKVLANRTSVLQHIESKHTNANDRIKCAVTECGKIFKSTSSLILHMKTIHPEVIKKCELCPKKSFYSEAELAEHHLKHAGSEKGQFACSICPRTFRSKHYLRSHFTSHEKEATCNICNVKFASAKTMLDHRERHGENPVITCRVNNCNQVFEDRREFMLHASQHPENEKKKAVCPHCGKTMGRDYLQGHINTHTGSKPHECSHCKKRFAKSGSLRRHLLIHSGKKPYVCDIEGCEKAYRDSIDLKRHKFSVHKIYTKKHICPICSKVFSERKLLTKHTTNVHNKVDAIEAAL